MSWCDFMWEANWLHGALEVGGQILTVGHVVVALGKLRHRINQMKDFCSKWTVLTPSTLPLQFSTFSWRSLLFSDCIIEFNSAPAGGQTHMQVRTHTQVHTYTHTYMHGHTTQHTHTGTAHSTPKRVTT